MAAHHADNDTANNLRNYTTLRDAYETMDQLRTRTAELSAPQRSTMDTSDERLRPDNHGGPIWGSRGRRFKSGQPDRAKYLVKPKIHLSNIHFMIIFTR